MQGVLKEFRPLMKNGVHDQYNENYKFIVVIEENGSPFEGEAFAKTQNGSKSWALGTVHEFERVPNDYCHGKTRVKGLKKLEAAPPTASSPQQGSGAYVNRLANSFEKESYTISRFAHTIALDYVNSLPEKDSAKMREEKGGGLISDLAKTIAKSVYNVAKEVQKMNEGSN